MDEPGWPCNHQKNILQLNPPLWKTLGPRRLTGIFFTFRKLAAQFCPDPFDKTQKYIALDSTYTAGVLLIPTRHKLLKVQSNVTNINTIIFKFKGREGGRVRESVYMFVCTCHVGACQGQKRALSFLELAL